MTTSEQLRVRAEAEQLDDLFRLVYPDKEIVALDMALPASGVVAGNGEVTHQGRIRKNDVVADRDVVACDSVLKAQASGCRQQMQNAGCGGHLQQI